MRIYTNPAFRRHQTGPGHPESVDRIDSAIAGVMRAGAERNLISEAALHPETGRLIARTHSPHYERALASAVERGLPLFQSLDNPLSPGTYEAAKTAVGISLTAAEDVFVNRTDRRAFVIARPPGHHATREQAMGFCFFNTMACVAEYLREQPGLERVLIFDWDVHHGNGTQDLFENRSDVFYISTHRYPFYPGTGARNEIGIGAGRGFTRNFPFAQGFGDAQYLRTVEDEIIPLIDDYRPDAILVSAGFDAHHRDPLGGMRVTEQAFGVMTRRMAEAAERHCDGRMLALLEGGYSPEGLAASVAEHIEAASSIS
ncbi:MAG: histone deacetylase [Acidobacteriota bacterium]